MEVFERQGEFIPSLLHTQLTADGVAVQGVTATDNASGTVVAVQIICDDGTDEAAVDASIANYPQAVTEVKDAKAATQWATVDSVRGKQLRQTDFAIEPFTVDLPDEIQIAFKSNEQAWLAFRTGLRNIQSGSGDPTQLVWPTLPPAPKVVITPPPDFVQWDWSNADWVPA